MTWRSTKEDEKVEILHSIDACNRARGEAFYMRYDGCTLDISDLPFYPDTKLLKLSGADIPGSPRWYVQLPKKKGKQEIVPMGRDIDAVHHCNAEAPLVLNDDTIYTYLKFRYFFAEGARVFELKVKNSAVGYSGKIWLFRRGGFFEIDVNVSARGNVTELEKHPLPDISGIADGEFGL